MKFATIVILLIAMLNLVPSLFTEGAIFDVHGMTENDCGEIVDVGGIYWDNAYFTIIELLCMFLAFSLPLIFDLPKWFGWVCLVFAGWGLTGFATEVMNWFHPLGVYNSVDDKSNFTWWVTLIISSIAFIILNENIKKINER